MPLTLSVEELRSWIRLSLEPGLGAAQARNLLAALGLPQEIYATSATALSRLLPEPLARQLRQAPDERIETAIADTLAWLQQPSHYLLTLADPAYPRALLDTHDPPLLLYANGNPALLNRPAIAIVGARNASPGGVENATAFARYLAEQGWSIISGLAQGIDTAAHEGALLAGPEAGSTLAVLGTGIDIVYPASNRNLAHRIAQHGLLLSEFPLGTRALRYQFPKRNRLVAGMAKGVLVVEAAKQSGSLITARLASETGREVFAIPGSIHSPLSRGCHALIRQGAKLVESAQDILEELGPPATTPSVTVLKGGIRPPAPSKTAKAPNTPVQDPLGRQVLDAMGHDPVHIDQLQARSHLDLPTLNGLLLQLELADMVIRQSDGRFIRR